MLALMTPLEQHLEDWAQTDTEIRESAAGVLPEIDVYGDPAYTPAIEDIVDSLVDKIKALEIVVKLQSEELAKP